MKKILILLPILILLSCKSNPDTDDTIGTSLLGVVYDGRSNPVLNAELTIRDLNDSIITRVKTDINGKFFINELPFQKYKISVKAERCLATEIQFDHFDIENVLIVKVKTYEDMVLTLEEYMKKGDWENTESYIKDIESVDPDDIYFLYLKAIYYVKTDRSSEAIELLAPLKKLNHKYIDQLLEDLNEKSH